MSIKKVNWEDCFLPPDQDLRGEYLIKIEVVKAGKLEMGIFVWGYTGKGKSEINYLNEQYCLKHPYNLNILASPRWTN